MRYKVIRILLFIWVRFFAWYLYKFGFLDFWILLRVTFLMPSTADFGYNGSNKGWHFTQLIFHWTPLASKKRKTKNKKVLLRECKRHTTHCIASARYVDLSHDGKRGGTPSSPGQRGGTSSSPGQGGTPSSLDRGLPHPFLDGGGVVPQCTLLSWSWMGVPPISRMGTPCPDLGWDPPISWMGYPFPANVNGQTPVKT